MSLKEEARRAKKVTVDGQTIERHDIHSQIAAERHEDANRTAQRKNLGMKIVQLRNKGTV